MSEQEHLYAEQRRVINPDDCAFYHVMEIPGYGTTDSAQWDLRGSEPAYLGHIDLAGKRVLEIGPASGYLTFYMESQGAEVVSVELSTDVEWDIVPDARIDMQEFVALRRRGLERSRNAYWFAHERMGSRAKIHYGNIYALPEELGTFDVAVLCSVLLHVRDPLRVWENCARLADTVVVTDMHYPDFPNDRPMMQFFTTPVPAPDVWWRFTPALFSSFAEVMGFRSNGVTFHEQMYVYEPPSRPGTMFTVVSSK